MVIEAPRENGSQVSQNLPKKFLQKTLNRIAKGQIDSQDVRSISAFAMQKSGVLGAKQAAEKDNKGVLKQINAVFESQMKRKKVLDLRPKDYIVYFLQFAKRCFGYKKKQIKFTVGKVKERLDIVYILNKLVEIDKLKMLFLDPQQIKLFEYLPKPVVPKQADSVAASAAESQLQCSRSAESPAFNRSQIWNMMHSDKSYIEKVSEAYKSYNQIMQRPRLSEIDSKLIDLLDPQLKQYFRPLRQNEDHKHTRLVHYNAAENANELALPKQQYLVPLHPVTLNISAQKILSDQYDIDKSNRKANFGDSAAVADLHAIHSLRHIISPELSNDQIIPESLTISDIEIPVEGHKDFRRSYFEEQ